MRRALLYEVERFRLESVESPQPQPGEVTVTVEACGICGSDLHMYRGRHPVLKPPLIMGHEFVGTVTALGAGASPLGLGDRVVAMAARGCGACPRCDAGDWNQCTDLLVIGAERPGGLGEEVTLPWDQFVRIPTSISVEEAALIEVAAVAMHATRRYGSIEGKSCLILGAGPIGLTLSRVLVALKAGSVAISDISDARRDLAGAGGIDRVFDLNSPQSQIGFSAAYPDGVDVAFDCAGQEATLQQALRLTRPGGAVVLTAIFERDCLVPMLLLQRAERHVLGVQLYQRSDFESVISMILSEELDLSGIVTHTFPLEKVDEAFRLLLDGRSAAGKVLVQLSHNI